MNESSFVIPIFRWVPRRLESPLLLARRSIASERRSQCIRSLHQGNVLKSPHTGLCNRILII
jgi:hypothetical protein